MSPLWRRKPLHERLAEEGGLVVRDPGEPPAPWDRAGIHGVHRPRRWDAVVAVEAAGLPGGEVTFVALEDGTLLVDDDVPEDALAPLADALDQAVRPPYRAQGVRRQGDVWAVGANRVRTVELEDDPGGDVVEVTLAGGERTVLVDGARTFGSVPGLERLLDGDGTVHAERLDGALWEIRLGRL